MLTLTRWLEAVRRRKYSHWLIAYGAAAWGITEATGFLIDNYGASRRLLDVVLYLVLVFLFVLVVLVWHHGDKGPQRVTRREGGLLAILLFLGLGGSLWIATGDRPPPAAGGPASGSEPLVSEVVADLGEGSVAVMPFRSTVDDPELSWLDRALAELLSTNLAQVGALKVVSGQRIFDLLGQLGVRDRDEISERTQSRLARLSGASLIVTGAVFGGRGDLTIATTLADAATGEIRASATARGSDVFALVDEISADLRDQLGTGTTALASTAQLTTPDIEAYRAYEEGRQAYLFFRYSEAAEHFERAVEIDSAFALARFRRGLTLYQLGRASEATEEIHRARQGMRSLSERDRLFIEAFDLFASDTTAAIAAVRELMRKYPDEKDARIIFAGVLAGRRGPADPEARRLLEETLRLDPSYAAGYNMLAYAEAGAGNLEAADSLIGIYVELEPNEPNPWDSRGELLELSGRHEEARIAYREALQLEPTFRFSLDHLIRSHLIEDEPVAAREELGGLLVSPLPEVRIRSRALNGDTYLWQGLIDEGLADFEAAERAAAEAGLFDLRAWRLRDLVRTHLALENFGAAADAAESVRQLEPLDGWWITALYDSLVTVGDVDGMRLWKPRVEAQIGGNPLTRQRVATISRLIDVWIAYVEGRHERVLILSAELPESMRAGVLTAWPVYRSMLELEQADALFGALERFRDPNLFLRGPRFMPLEVRWAQYFEARAHEMLGDTAAAISDYEALVDGLGPGLARLPAIADAATRLDALTASH